MLHLHLTTKTLLKVFYESIKVSNELYDLKNPVHSIELNHDLTCEKDIICVATLAMDINKN